MAVLATVTAVGGGVIRDVLIGDLPPAALTDPWSLLIPLAAAVLTFFFHPRVARMGHTVQLFDAIGLGVFCATATTKAAAAGIPPLAAVLLGTITGVGGGILRDVLAGQTPSVLRKESELYAIPPSRALPWSRWPTHSAAATPRSRLSRPQASSDSDYSR